MTNLSSLSKSSFALLAGMIMLVGALSYGLVTGHWIMVVLTAPACFTLVLAFRWQKMASGSIKALSVVLERSSQGDLDRRIVLFADRGEMRQIADSLNRTLDLSEAFVKEANGAMQYANQRKYFRTIVPVGLRGSYIGYADNINVALKAMGQRDNTLNDFISYVDQNVKAIAENVVCSAEEMTDQADEIARHVSDTSTQASVLSEAASNASLNAQAVASATEEFTASINEISEQMNRVASGAEEAVGSVKHAEQVMAGLTEAASRIGTIVQMISDIAAQTNLLALNATIEAARAGDAGKGFAVVASEVKNLAAQTGKSTEEITAQVGAMQQAVANVQTSISDINSKVTVIGESSVAVSAAIEEQRTVTAEIARNIGAVSTATSDVSGAVGVVSASAQQSNGLTGQVSSGAGDLASKAGEMRSQIDGLLQRLAAA